MNHLSTSRRIGTCARRSRYPFLIIRTFHLLILDLDLIWRFLLSHFRPVARRTIPRLSGRTAALRVGHMHRVHPPRRAGESNYDNCISEMQKGEFILRSR